MYAVQLALLLQTGLVAASSIIYELTLAQTLAAILGGTLTQYSITIGLYMASLGAGAFFFDSIKPNNHQKTFIQVELLMTFLGITSIFIMIFLFKNNQLFPSNLQNLTIYLVYLPVLIIGFISGYEIPLLFSIGKDIQLAENRILSADYVGMFIGTVVFPLFLLKSVGTLGSALVAALINGIIACYQIIKSPKIDKAFMTILIFNLFAILYLFLNLDYINKFLTMYLV